MALLLHLVQLLQEPELLLDVLRHLVIALGPDDIQSVFRYY